MSDDHESQLQLPKSGGFRKLKSFKLARLCYDITIRFCNLYIPLGSRTRDQMEQAARSGVQNIAEGSKASATSKMTEIRLTNVARASLTELSLDYEDFLRQHALSPWKKDHPLYQAFVERKIDSSQGFRSFIEWAEDSNPDVHKSVLVSNGALLLLRVADYLLNRQVDSLIEDFKKNGDFPERLKAIRREVKKGQKKP